MTDFNSVSILSGAWALLLRVFDKPIYRAWGLVGPLTYTRLATTITLRAVSTKRPQQSRNYPALLQEQYSSDLILSIKYIRIPDLLERASLITQTNAKICNYESKQLQFQDGFGILVSMNSLAVLRSVLNENVGEAMKTSKG